jgi:hypothetical protein
MAEFAVPAWVEAFVRAEYALTTAPDETWMLHVQSWAGQYLVAISGALCRNERGLPVITTLAEESVDMNAASENTLRTALARAIARSNLRIGQRLQQ